jgi:hypothetical protein
MLSGREFLSAVVSNASGMIRDQSLASAAIEDSLYAISDGTLSDVMLFPPGHLFAVSFMDLQSFMNSETLLTS